MLYIFKSNFSSRFNNIISDWVNTDPVEIASIITFRSKVVCSTNVSSGVAYSVRVTTDVFDIKVGNERNADVLLM